MTTKGEDVETIHYQKEQVYIIIYIYIYIYIINSEQGPFYMQLHIYWSVMYHKTIQ